MSPTLSVVIPAYNAATVLPEQLRAVAALDGLPSHEVIVVDNRSSDATAEVAASMAELFDELRVVPAVDQAGTCYARNQGAKAARGEILLFVDADDLIAPDYLHHALATLESVDVVGGQVVQFNDRGWNADGDYEFHEPRRVSGEVLAERSTNRLGWLPVVNHGGMVIRRATFDELGGLDENLTYGGDEPEFSFRVQTEGYRLAFSPEAIMYFRADPTDMGTKFRKSYSIGRSDPYLYKRFRAAGMPRARLRDTASMWWWLLRTTPLLLRDESHRSHWGYHAGRRLGRVVGSLRHRVRFF